MAQATLTERSGLANNSRFQSRMQSALKKKAAYWNSFVATIVGDYNLQLQLRKRFAKQVLAGYYQNIQPYCEYFMSQYNDDVEAENVSNPDVSGAGNRKEDPGNPLDVTGNPGNQLADFELTDSGAADLVFDYFAGVQAGDDTEGIIW